MEIVLDNPYQHFYAQHRADVLEDKAEGDVELDEYATIEADPVFIQKTIKEQIKAAKRKAKEANADPWVSKAMEYDPAFMIDPINDYYLKMIPESLQKSLTHDQLMEFVSLQDPITWAERNLSQKHGGWKPRVSKKGFPYQAQMIRCTSKRIVSRAGRRIGKSASIVVRILHKMFTFVSDDKAPVYNIVIFTPNQAQIDLIFKMMELFIDGNEKLLSMIKDGKIPTRKSPYHMLELTNGATVKGFVSGSTAIRGQAANLLVIDEGSFLTTDDTDAVVSLLAENEDVEFWVSSTPKGLKDYFYDRVMDPKYVSFYFPTDKYHPNWSHAMESEFRSQLTDAGFRHEVLADFSADGEGVFQHQFVSRAMTEYKYEEQKRTQGWIYGMGVDWNDTENGSQILVVGYDRARQKYRVVDRSSVSVDGWTQLSAVQKVAELNRKWHCSFIYVDNGFGATQVELLHEKGMKAPPKSIDKKLLNAKSINFSSTLIIRDPWTKKKTKKPVKPYMVNNSVRVLEGDHIELSEDDTLLKKQMEGYIIDRITPAGMPVYGHDKKVGDHVLDALMLALLGFHMEMSSLAKPRLGGGLGVLEHGELSLVEQQSVADQLLQRDKLKEKKEYDDAWAGVNKGPQNSENLVSRRAKADIRATRSSRIRAIKNNREPRKRRAF